jgi:hypothetical protein
MSDDVIMLKNLLIKTSELLECDECDYVRNETYFNLRNDFGSITLKYEQS